MVFTLYHFIAVSEPAAKRFPGIITNSLSHRTQLSLELSHRDLRFSLSKVSLRSRFVTGFVIADAKNEGLSVIRTAICLYEYVIKRENCNVEDAVIFYTKCLE